MIVRPKPGTVMIERFKEEEKEGSIYRADSYRKMTNKGRIARLGKETPDKPQLYKESDIVYFSASINMLPIVEDEKPYAIINQLDIMGVEE